MAETWTLIGANASAAGQHVVFHFKTDSDRPIKFALTLDDTVALGPTGLREVELARANQGADPWFVAILGSSHTAARAAHDQVLIHHELEGGGKIGFLYTRDQVKALVEEIASAAGLQVLALPTAPKQ